MEFRFYNTCVNMHEKQLKEIDNNAKEIKYYTFKKYIKDIKEFSEDFLGYNKKIKLKNDSCVSFEKSKLGNLKVFVLHWSAIHYVWIEVKNG